MLIEKVSPAAYQPESWAVGQPLVTPCKALKASVVPIFGKPDEAEKMGALKKEQMPAVRQPPWHKSKRLCWWLRGEHSGKLPLRPNKKREGKQRKERYRKERYRKGREEREEKQREGIKKDYLLLL
eukprot:1160394-Pelagomonas_calceolata.AAC.2